MAVVRMVELRHDELGTTTRQPASTAKVLEQSGWTVVEDDKKETAQPSKGAAAKESSTKQGKGN